MIFIHRIRYINLNNFLLKFILTIYIFNKTFGGLKPSRYRALQARLLFFSAMQMATLARYPESGIRNPEDVENQVQPRARTAMVSFGMYE